MTTGLGVTIWIKYLQKKIQRKFFMNICASSFLEELGHLFMTTFFENFFLKGDCSSVKTNVRIFGNE